MNRTAMGLALVASLGVAGCSASSGGASAAPPMDVRAVFGLFGAGDPDTVTTDSIAEVASGAELMVTGRLVGCSNGLTVGFPDDGIDDLGSRVLALKPESTGKGHLKKAGATTYFLLLGGPADDQCQEMVKKSPRVAIYLNEYKGGTGSKYMPVNNPEAGRPAGEPLYIPAHTQGFAVEAVYKGRKGVALPLEGDFVDATLENMLPEGDALKHKIVDVRSDSTEP